MPREASPSPEPDNLPLQLDGGTGESSRARAISIASGIVSGRLDLTKLSETDIALLAHVLVKLIGSPRPADPTASARVKRARQRAEQGELVTQIVLPRELSEDMLDCGLMRDEDSESKERRAAAIVAILRDAVRSRSVTR